MQRLALSLVLALALPLPAGAEDYPPPPSLVVDGIPPIPAAIVAAARRYGEFRTASFRSWHPVERKALIAARAGATTQIFLVEAPGGPRRQLTSFPDPVSSATFQPTHGRYFVFSKDVGGGEWHQKYRYELATGAVTLLTDGKSLNTRRVEP